MNTPTPEERAEWREDADNTLVWTDDLVSLYSRRILVLLDALDDADKALTAEKARADKAEAGWADAEKDVERLIQRAKKAEARVAEVEAERDLAEARLKTARYDTQVHKLNSARATTAREDALILRDAAQQALADLREKVAALADEWERVYVGFVRHDLAPALRALLAAQVQDKPERWTTPNGRVVALSQVQDKPDVAMHESSLQDKPEATCSGCSAPLRKSGALMKCDTAGCPGNIAQPRGLKDV